MRRLAFLLSCAAGLGLQACSSYQNPTAPSEDLALAEVQAYSAIDLGTLGGNYSQAAAISPSGQVVGHSETADGQVHAFVWHGGVMTDLGTLGGNYSYALSIDPAGDVVGYSDLPGGATHAFIWQDGVMKDLGTLGGLLGRPCHQSRAKDRRLQQRPRRALDQGGHHRPGHPGAEQRGQRDQPQGRDRGQHLHPVGSSRGGLEAWFDDGSRHPGRSACLRPRNQPQGLCGGLEQYELRRVPCVFMAAWRDERPGHPGGELQFGIWD